MADNTFSLVELSKNKLLTVVLVSSNHVIPSILPIISTRYSESEIMFINSMNGRDRFINIDDISLDIATVVYPKITNQTCENQEQINLGNQIFEKLPNATILVFGGDKLSLMIRDDHEMSKDEKKLVDKFSYIFNFIETAINIKTKLSSRLNTKNLALN